MKIEQKPLVDLTNEAIGILMRELGAADTLRFLGQYTNGRGDYTEERRAWVDSMSLDEILGEIRDQPPTDPSAPAAS